jgi:(p)ppGpp synthase/HD superfamily hydrolase
MQLTGGDAGGMQVWTQEGYLETVRFAAQAHAGQTVPGTNLPYLLHVTLVGMEVIAALRTESDRDQELAVRCALLHDIVEDTPATVDQLRAAFGPAVANGVSALSKNKALPKDRRLEDSLHRIREQPAEIWMVKLADRITNLQPPPAHWSAEKIALYREEAIFIHASLKDASPALATRLSQKIAAYGAVGKRGA